MPYIYTLAARSYFDDYSMMRGLIMDFPQDKNVHSIGDQYMFGNALMVCPVYEFKARSRKVYFPAGTNWYDFYSGKMIKHTYEAGRAYNFCVWRKGWIV
jgi:alpha-D-xyloside xylohydrolase